MWLELDKRATVTKGFARAVAHSGRRCLARAVHGRFRSGHERVVQTSIDALKVLAAAGRRRRCPKLVVGSVWIHACVFSSQMAN